MAARARSGTLGTGLALAVLAATAVTLPAQAAGVPPQPTGLSDSSPNTTTTALSWEREPLATGYTVQVDNDEAFTSPEFNKVTTNVSVVPETALKAGRNHWRVRATAPGNLVSEWATATFDRPDPMVPQVVSPADGAELVQPDEPPLLQWSEVPGAKSYTVEIDDAADFIGSRKTTTNTTSTVPATPLALGTWFWRVTATDSSGQVSLASEPSTFAVRALPAPALVSPADSANEKVEDVVLDWAPVEGAASYQLQVSVNDGFEAGSLITNLPLVRSTRYSPPAGFDNDQYFWRVRALDAAGSPSAWSVSPHNFERSWADRPWPVAPVQPGFPAYPADFDTSDPAHAQHPFYDDYVRNHDPEDRGVAVSEEQSPFLQWTPVQHASQYEVQLSSTPAFVKTNTSTCTVAGTTFTPTNASYPSGKLDHVCPVQEGTQYYWRVRAIDKPFPVEGIYSPTQKFVWKPTWLTEFKPARNAAVSTPTFSWKSRVAAQEFRVEVQNNRGERVATGTTSANSWTSPTKLDPAESPFTWSLTAYTTTGTPSLRWSNQFTLTAPGGSVSDLPPLTALTGTAADAPTMRAPRLSWTPHPEAAFYRVHFGHAGIDSWLIPTNDESFGKDLAYPSLTDTGTRIMNPGRYKWRVEAYTESGERLATSGTNVVRVAGFEEVSGQRIGLDGAALASGGGCDLPLDTVNNVSTCPEVPTTPVLTWEPQDGIAFYAVYVSYDQHFTNLTEPNSIPATVGTMYAYDLLTLPDNTSGVPYYWHIRPCKAIGICGPDPVSAATGLAKHAFKKVSPRVETFPTSDVVGTDEVTFSWRDYHDSNQNHRVTRDGAPSWSATYHEAPAAGGAINPKDLSNQSAASYRIRVATDATFNRVIDTQTVEQTTYTATRDLYPEGPLHWRVSALDVNGNELSSSVARTFTKSSRPVTTSAPGNGDRVSGTVPFRWKAQAFAGQYELEVSRNDRLFSSTNRLFTAKVWTTAYTWTKPIPVSSDPYFWRVRRIDSSNNPTAWSDAVEFRVVPQPVTLVSPADGSTQSPNGASLVWEPVTGAATYLVEVRDATGKVVETRTTPATAHAPLITLSAGKHTWSVTARDNDGKNLAAPVSRTFTVDSALVATSDPVIGYDTEQPQVDSVLSVAPLGWNRQGVVESYQWLRNGAAVKGATKPEYTTTVTDYDKTISVRVTGSLPSYVSSTVTSGEVRIGPGDMVIASAPPVISGTTKVGQRLSATVGAWPAGTRTSFQWLRNGSPISGATSSRYALTLADAATRISVRVTGRIVGRTDGTSTSTTRTVPKAASTTTIRLSKSTVKRGTRVTLSGMVAVGSVAGPTGTVVVKRGNKKLKTIRLSVGQRGQVSLVLPKKLKKGRHKLRLLYSGTSKIAPSKSKVLVLRIT